MATTPVIIKQVRYKDEGVDVTGNALKGEQAYDGRTGDFFQRGNDEQPKGVNVEEMREKEGVLLVTGGGNLEAIPDPNRIQPPTPEPTSTPATSTSTPPASPPTISTSTAPIAEQVTEKLYAGKFKTVEDLEKGYIEEQKIITQKSQEAATARKALEEREKAAPKTPEETEAQRLERVNQMLSDPQWFEKEARKATEAVEAQQKLVRQQQQVIDDWREQNKDMTGTLKIGEEEIPLEQFVGAEMARITANDPNIDPVAALTKATTHIRASVGILIDRGRREALAVQSESTHLADSKINTPPPTEQPNQAPMSEKSAFDAHMASLRAGAASVRRPVR